MKRQTESETTVKAAREVVRTELAAVLSEIETLNRRATALQQTLSGMNAMLGSNEINIPAASTDVGMTEAIRRVFRFSNGSVLTAPQIRDHLVRMCFDITKYAQPMVPLHNTLKRLESQGEIKAMQDAAMRPAYVWILN